MKNPRLLILCLLLLPAACQGPISIPDKDMWNGAVELPEGISVPFRMSLDFTGDKPEGYFLVGDEKTPIPEISKNGNFISMVFSEYGAEIRATWQDMYLEGNYLRIRSDGTKSLRFAAAPESLAPASASSSNTALPVGNYQVSFPSDDKPDESTVAKLWNKDGVLQGTFIAPDGDYGLLVGKPRGPGFQLSRFTGWQAIAVVLKPEGTDWSGSFYAASSERPRPFTLRPRADLNVESADVKKAAVKDPNAGFAFSGVSLSGETVRHTDDRFKGKALIVDIMGTWCHNCLDEAPVLEQLQKQYGKDGLEIVGLSFEISADPEVAKKNLQLFKDRFGLTYTVLFNGSLDDENVRKQIHSQVDNFFAYPTAIFIDKNHKVRSIHSGFKGPGTGEEFQKQIREFQELAAGLVK